MPSGISFFFLLSQCFCVCLRVQRTTTHHNFSFSSSLVALALPDGSDGAHDGEDVHVSILLHCVSVFVIGLSFFHSHVCSSRLLPCPVC